MYSDVMLWVVESAWGRYSLHGPHSYQLLRTLFVPILRCVSRTVHGETQLAAHVIFSWVPVFLLQLNIDVSLQLCMQKNERSAAIAFHHLLVPICGGNRGRHRFNDLERRRGHEKTNKKIQSRL